MASYFDPQPQQSKPAATADGVDLPKDAEEIGRMGLLSPQVTRILDDLDLEGYSSSSDEDDSLSGDSKASDQEASKDKRHQKSQHKDTQTQQSHQRDKKHQRLAPPRPGLGVGGREKQPHFARFHSLRSMLFSSRIEADIQRSNEAREQEEAEEKWKAQHESRKAFNRPKTPERPSSSGSNSPTKEGFRHRIGDKIRRMTSREVSTMGKLPENEVAEINDNESTASSDSEEEEDTTRLGKPRVNRDVDEESINHSDVEELVRWVSRRDPPSDGESRRTRNKDLHDDYESLGNSDVEDLVRWVSRNPTAEKSRPTDRREPVEHMGYSDASTASDSEGEGARRSSPDEDAEDLVRWISRKDGPNAGPVRPKQEARAIKVFPNPSDSDHDSNPPELARWISRHDDTSGESDVHDSGRDTPSRAPETSQDKVTRPANRSTLTHDDIDDLVRWVSRKDSKAEPPKDDDTASEIKQKEQEKKQQIGMQADAGSLSHNDISKLVNFVKSKERDQSDKHEHVRPGRGESQDIDKQDFQVKEQEKKEQLGMTADMDSLSHRDVNELVEWVSKRS